MGEKISLVVLSNMTGKHLRILYFITISDANEDRNLKCIIHELLLLLLTRGRN